MTFILNDPNNWWVGTALEFNVPLMGSGSYMTGVLILIVKVFLDPYSHIEQKVSSGVEELVDCDLTSKPSETHSNSPCMLALNRLFSSPTYLFKMKKIW